MSEPMFPTATAEEAVPFAAPAEEAAGSGGNRKALLAVGGVVAALVVGGGAFFLLTGSGSGGSDEAFVPTVPQKSAAPSAKPSASGGTRVRVQSSMANSNTASISSRPRCVASRSSKPR